MRLALSWLRDLAPIEASVADLTTTLNELGLVVDGVEVIGGGLEEVVAARVDEIRPIKGADRIRHVTVDAGSGPVEIVCGAWNFEVGDTVPLAPVGTVLPNGMEIAARRMRGVVSNGMLCSPAELGLADDAAGLLLLPVGAEPGAPVTAVLGIRPDVVFDLDITPNRPDAMSVAGVARDLAAAYRVPFALPDVELAERGVDVSSLATLEVEDEDLCPLFSIRVITDVVVGESPELIRRRLVLAGMRPINSVVDASNYVMLELGQPNHPYDLDRLAAPGLRVRAARPGETVQTLDGVVREVGGPGSRDCLICDANDSPVGVAGVMGGESSEISDSTRRVLLEAAYFSPMAIARTSKRLGLRTEASARFERGCDPETVEQAAARVCALITGAAPGARVAAGALVRGRAPARPRITLRVPRVNALLGTKLSAEAVAGYLEPIGFGVAPAAPSAALAASGPTASEAFDVEVPGWRPDVTGEIDLVEEVARHHGYSRIERTVPTTTQVGELTAFQRERRRVRDVMVGAGLVEMWTPSLLGPPDHASVGIDGPSFELSNPMSREESVLRRSMMPGMLRALRYNAGHRNSGLRVFEVGRVFSAESGGLPGEREIMSAALNGTGDDAAAAVLLWRTLADALRLEDVRIEAAPAAGLHPTRTARLCSGDDAVGLIGEIDRAILDAYEIEGRVAWLEVDLDALHKAPRRPAVVQPVSVYPSSDIDLAFAVDESVPAAAVEAALMEGAGDLLVSIRLFDVYRDEAVVGAGRRSLAYRLRFAALDRTLTDGEVAEVRSRCVAAVEGSLPALLRG